MASGLTGMGIPELIASTTRRALNPAGGKRSYATLDSTDPTTHSGAATDLLAGAATAAAGGPAIGLGTFDGVSVANWFIPYLQWARANGWKGKLVSGHRDPAYSESLCFKMCGAASCSGTCAGKSSNHSGVKKPQGAIDVTDEANFAALMKRCPFLPHIFNDLPADRVHFSATGH